MLRYARGFVDRVSHVPNWVLALVILIAVAVNVALGVVNTSVYFEMGLKDGIARGRVDAANEFQQRVDELQAREIELERLQSDLHAATKEMVQAVSASGFASDRNATYLAFESEHVEEALRRFKPDETHD